MPPTLCSLLTVALILWLTLAPDPTPDMDVDLAIPGIDKVVHAIMFGFLTWMLYVDYGKVSHREPRLRAIVWCAMSSLTLGAIVEWLQRIMALGRSMEWADLLADATGCLIALWLILWLRERLQD